MNKNNREYWQRVHNDFESVWHYYYYAEDRLKKNPDRIKEISILLNEINTIIEGA